jgi:glycosyltransferase involved in cell wall biosynthesis
MKPLLINTYDSLGGAAIATYRLHRALLTEGIHSQLYVQKKITQDPTVINPHSIFGKINPSLRYKLDRCLLFPYRTRDPAYWSPAWVPNLISHEIKKINPEIVHLHWICDGFIPVSALRKIDRPLFWTFHDMWPMTGGCHYAGTCEKYQDHCNACPHLKSQKQNDLSSWVWKRKEKYWMDLDVTVVTPSKWLAECAKKSALFKNQTIKVIPNCLDINQFRPFDKVMTRNTFSLPLDKNLILFGAVDATSDKRKGFHLLKEALKHLSASGDDSNAELVIFGNLKETGQLETKMKVHTLGKIPDENRLPLLYSAADVFIAPSLQENLSNTVMESLACGTPVVAFNVGGMPDMIDHKSNGYLARPFECQDLSDGISWILKNEKQREHLSTSARKKVLQNYETTNIAQQYIKLYENEGRYPHN